MPRKPVSAAVLGSLLIVVCDDGSVWELEPNGGWIARRPVPGTEAAAMSPGSDEQETGYVYEGE
ncbi:MAG TPA: hypothetical protein VGE02_06735 [Gemmatimonadales bacterium]